MTHGCMWREMWEEGGGRKIFTSFFFVGTVTGKVDFPKDRSMSTGLQVGDRVRKIGPVNGADLEQEGRVKRVDEVVKGGRVVGTKVVVECAAGGRVWKLQNATNFARLLEDAAERPTVSQQAVGAAAAPPSRRPPAAPGAAAAVSLTEGPAEAPSDDHHGFVWLASPNAPAAVPPSDAPPPRPPPPPPRLECMPSTTRHLSHLSRTTQPRMSSAALSTSRAGTATCSTCRATEGTQKPGTSRRRRPFRLPQQGASPQ